MTKTAVLMALGLVAAPVTAAAESLDALLEEVRQNRRQVSAEVQARLVQFRAQRDNQAALLRDVQEQLAAAEAVGADLSAQFEARWVMVEVMDGPGVMLVACPEKSSAATSAGTQREKPLGTVVE